MHSLTDTTARPGTSTRPDAIDAIPADLVVELDVRDDLRNGEEPFTRIMAARDAVPAGGALKLRAIFEPVPLYRVLGRDGFEHWTEQLDHDDWLVWFHRPDDAPEAAPAPPRAAAAANALEADAGEETGIVLLDVRGLEPPEPMVRTLAALEALPPGHTLVQINAREPRFLLPHLTERGFTYEVREQAPDLVRVFIRRAQRVLDVRVIPPREKHPAIFETFEALAPGGSFVLVSDHDPKPLRYQFEFEYRGEYGWEYLEEGPEVWRVEISRVA